MDIRNFYYDDCKILTIDFSTEDDGDDYYRKLELDINDVFYYSPETLSEEDIELFSENDVIELINQYLLENDLPEKEFF